jgi:hypothetical protein
MSLKDKIPRERNFGAFKNVDFAYTPGTANYAFLEDSSVNPLDTLFHSQEDVETDINEGRVDFMEYSSALRDPRMHEPIEED